MRKTLEKIIFTAILASAVALSPKADAQASQIIFTQDTITNSSTRQLISTNADGTNRRVLYDSVTTDGTRARFSPDGKQIALVNASGQMVVLDNSGKELYRFAAGGRSGEDFTWDGNSTLFWGDYTPGIFKTNLPNAPKQIIWTPGFRYFHNPAPNPFNNILASVLHEYGSTNFIYLSDKDGKNLNLTLWNNSPSNYDEQLDLSWVSPTGLLWKNEVVDSLYYYDTATKTKTAYSLHHPLSSIRVSPNDSLVAACGKTTLSIFDTQQLGNAAISTSKKSVVSPLSFAWAADSRHYAVVSSYAYNKCKIIVFDINGQEYAFQNKSDAWIRDIDWNNVPPTNLIPTDVRTDEKTIPQEFKISPVYPNPFNSSTTLQYQLSKDSDISIKVYDVLGREVMDVAEGHQHPGSYNRILDFTKNASGVYFLRSIVNGKVETQELVPMK